MTLIYDALACDSGARVYHLFISIPLPTNSTRSASDLILSRARGVEKAVLIEFDGTTAAYRAKIRSLFVNLKDKNNPGLRESVVSGDLSVEKFSKMTSQASVLDFGNDICQRRYRKWPLRREKQRIQRS
jgi:transcription elongation factor S-II